MAQAIYASYGYSSSIGSRRSCIQETSNSSLNISSEIKNERQNMWRSLPNTPMLPPDAYRGASVPCSKLETSIPNERDIHSIPIQNNPSSPEELDVVIGFLPFDFPMAPTAQAVSPKRKLKKKIPSPIHISSCSASLNLPPGSAPMPRNAGWDPHPDLKGYVPSSPINRSASVPLSAGHNTARCTPSIMTAHRASRDMGLSRATQATLGQARNVRFDVLKSPKYSHLRSPAYRGSFQSLHSPEPFSPKTPMDMCFEDPDIIPDSPISDEPMVSITPILDTLDTIQEEDGKENRPQSLPMRGRYKEEGKENRPSSLPMRGRQVDRETLMRLTGETPSPIEFEEDDCPALWRREVEEHPVFRSPAPPALPKGYATKTYRADRQSILGTYFHHDNY